MNNETEHIFLLNPAPSESTAPTQGLGTLEQPPVSQVNLDNVKDFSHVCRTCATITEFVMPIFADEGLQNNLADKIHKHLPIKVCKGDELPLVVCYQCASTLLAWHELVQCCMQADAALRAKLRSSQRKTNRPSIKPSTSIEEDTESKLLYSSVRNALLDFHIDLDEEDADVAIVCQKCVDVPALSGAHSLADHIRHDHFPEVLDNSVKTFITDYITFVQELAEDSDRETVLDKEEPPTVLPALLCPFCSSVFSSATRLVYHLNKHVEVNTADGVMCCDVVYSDNKHFVQHLQDEHVNRNTDDQLLVCANCDFTTHTAEQLKEHNKDAHSDVKNTKQKKTESANNQKYIPAVCPECNKTFSNKYNMFAHMRAHTHTAVYACDKCPRTYRNQGNLTHHKKLVHQGILKFICVECGEAFPSRAERDIHARLHSGETPYECQYCGKAYRAKNTLTKHLEIHADIRRYECSVCSKKFRKKSHLDYHVKTHMKQAPCASRACAPGAACRAQPAHAHELLFHCQLCDLLLERKDFLLHVSYHSVHYDTQDRLKKLKKELVSQNPSPVPSTPAHSSPRTETKPPDKPDNRKTPALARSRSVQENEFSDHSDMDDFGPLPESVFEAIEDSQDSQLLQDNSNQETEPLGDDSNKSSELENKNTSDSVQCLENNNFTNICAVVRDEPIDIDSCDQKVIKDSDTSNNDVLPANKTQSKTPEHTEKGKRNQNKLRKCPLCPKEYKASSSYFYHLKYFHKGSKEHECEVCGRKFGTRSCLTQHMAVHSAQYEFECKQCQKQFKSKASLYIHEQTHGGAKTWACSQCQTAFRWRTHLLRHMKRHAAEKAHVCDACGRGFSVRCDLLRHARTHTAGSFACDKCGQKFAQLRYLKVHTVKQHKTNVKKSK